MKKYEAMEALKVTFNAREQVAAACFLYPSTNGTKYVNAQNEYDQVNCEWNLFGTTWKLVNDMAGYGQDYEDGAYNEGAKANMTARYKG